MDVCSLIAAIRAFLQSECNKKLTVRLLEGSNQKCEVCLDASKDVEESLDILKRYLSGTGQIPQRISLGEIGELLVREVSGPGRLQAKVAVVTGGAQGLGEAFARRLLVQGAMVVIADRNVQMGEKLEQELQPSGEVIFVETDVSSAKSVEALVEKSVKRFGGIDILLSNAGIVYAGGLDMATEEEFDRISEVNFKGYFLCVRACSKIMKMQTHYDKKSYADIIQINSKSGLRGSKANFMYSSSKFAGIGLTQSFALELAPFRIKVNSICPGNYYDGELWSNPKNGLFVQYLNAGKVPGAKTVEDVKQYYLSQVPMRKGCSPDEIFRAIIYAIEQTGETGQAIPVTGGQTMLN